MGTTGVACQKPLGTDVLNHRVPTAFGSLLHLLDQGGCLRVFLLHSDQVGRTQFATCQIGSDLVIGWAQDIGEEMIRKGRSTNIESQEGPVGKQYSSRTKLIAGLLPSIIS